MKQLLHFLLTKKDKYMTSNMKIDMNIEKMNTMDMLAAISVLFMYSSGRFSIFGSKFFQQGPW